MEPMVAFGLLLNEFMLISTSEMGMVSALSRSASDRPENSVSRVVFTSGAGVSETGSATSCVTTSGRAYWASMAFIFSIFSRASATFSGDIPAKEALFS